MIISEEDEVESIEWCTYAITKISSVNNLLNTICDDPKCHEKDGAVEAKVNDDANKDEDATYSVIVIKITKFNKYVEHGWRLHFDVEWNNKMIQSNGFR